MSSRKPAIQHEDSIQSRYVLRLHTWGSSVAMRHISSGSSSVGSYLNFACKQKQLLVHMKLAAFHYSGHSKPKWLMWTVYDGLFPIYLSRNSHIKVDAVFHYNKRAMSVSWKKSNDVLYLWNKTTIATLPWQQPWGPGFQQEDNCLFWPICKQTSNAHSLTWSYGYNLFWIQQFIYI